MPKVRFPTKMRAAMAGALPCCLECGRFGHRQWSSVSLTTGFADRRGTPDLLGQHADAERRRWRIRLDVLAVRWLHWTLVMQPGDYSTRGTGPARAQSSGPHSRWTGAAGAGSSSAPAVLSLAYRSPFRFEHQRCTRASGCAAEPLEMLAKLRGLDVLILRRTWSIGIRARPRASTP